jgi:glutamyl endopeptidase
MAKPEAAPEPESREDLPVTDAWFGTFGTAVSRALSAAIGTSSGKPGATTLQKVSAMVAESVIGADDRVEIDETDGAPYGWICALSITAANGTRWLGTGWCAAPGLVVTAGHCVYIHNHGGWVRSIRVQPGRDGPNIPHSFESSLIFSVSGWVNDKSAASDYGAIAIPPTEGSRIGWFGYAARSDASLAAEVVNVVGYPSDKSSGTMWGSVHELSQPTTSELVYINDTVGGMSGSPVVEWDGKDYAVLGIHNYGDISGNRATRITPEVFRNLQRWAGAAQQPRSG